VTAERVRIAYFSNGTSRGGAEEHILTLLRGLDRERFQPFLICSPEVVEKLRADVPADVGVLSLRLSSARHLRGALGLARFLRQNRIQVLHSHLFYASLFASPIGWISRVPLIMETPHLRESWRHGWFKGSFFVDRLICRFVDIYIAVSEANFVYLRETKKLPARKIRVIQNGSDLDRFQPSHRAVIELKLSLGFEKDDPMLLVSARLEPQKGHCVLLEALPHVLREFPRTRVVFAGEGTLRKQLEEQTQRLALGHCVRFVGWQPNLEDWLALCDFTVLSSFYEGLPLVAVESLAAGRPMVATAVDGTLEVIVDGKTGLIVPPGDPQRLADAICRMLRDPAMRRDMAAAGRLWVLKRFTQKRQLDETQSAYLRGLERTLEPNANKPITVSWAARMEETDDDDDVHSGVRALSGQIVQSTAEACSQHFGSSLRAVILTGSLARNEGSVQNGQSSRKLASDAEFILVFHDAAPLPRGDELRNLIGEIKQQLADDGVHCDLHISCAHGDFLRKMRPHIFGYEMRTCGRVVAGEANILSLIPPFTPAEIPLEDAWRLLSNRMVELIEALTGSDADPFPAQVCYRTVKLYLDMATSLLLFAGEYAPSYKERCKNLHKLVSSGNMTEPFPFSLQLFSRAVDLCTAQKLFSRDLAGAALDREWVAAACGHAFQLWMWELQKITGLPEGSSPTELCLRAMKRQPVAARLRGWLFALRRCGWRDSITAWPRWLDLAQRASPRYCVYAVAGELFLRRDLFLRDLSVQAVQASTWDPLWNGLPMVPKTSLAVRDVRMLGRALAWNYHEFLEETRA
jgi:glycosyltransferase involved in cell wall biosynthesis